MWGSRALETRRVDKNLKRALLDARPLCNLMAPGCEQRSPARRMQEAETRKFRRGTGHGSRRWQASLDVFQKVGRPCAIRDRSVGPLATPPVLPLLWNKVQVQSWCYSRRLCTDMRLDASGESNHVTRPRLFIYRIHMSVPRAYAYSRGHSQRAQLVFVRILRTIRHHRFDLVDLGSKGPARPHEERPSGH